MDLAMDMSLNPHCLNILQECSVLLFLLPFKRDWGFLCLSNQKIPWPSQKPHVPRWPSYSSIHNCWFMRLSLGSLSISRHIIISIRMACWGVIWAGHTAILHLLKVRDWGMRKTDLLVYIQAFSSSSKHSGLWEHEMQSTEDGRILISTFDLWKHEYSP